MGNPRRQLNATLRHVAPSPVGHTDRSGRVLGDAVALKKPPLSRASQALKKDGVGATNQSDAGRTPGGRVSLATCQFPITDDIEENVAAVLAQMREAAAQGAQLVHFSECCLSGYAGVEFATFDGFDWPALVAATHRVQRLAAQLGVWVVVGSAHRLTGDAKPHNCLYIINDRGEIVDRYDKVFAVGSTSEDDADLAHYSPGSHFTVFEINGVRCGALICHDFRLKRGVQLVLHSYHNGHQAEQPTGVDSTNFALDWQDRNSYGGIVVSTMQAYAANNGMWISANNTSNPISAWPSFVVTPDGVVSEHLEHEKPGVLLTDVDTALSFHDGGQRWWRERVAKHGVLHSGTLVSDPRSDARDRLFAEAEGSAAELPATTEVVAERGSGSGGGE